MGSCCASMKEREQVAVSMPPFASRPHRAWSTVIFKIVMGLGGVVCILATSRPVSAQWCAPHFVAGYSTCNPLLGPSAENGEDLKIGYDVNGASGNVFLVQPDIHVRPSEGPILDFVRYYNSQSAGIDVGIGANWSHTYSWHVNVSSDGAAAVVVTDTGRIIQFTRTGLLTFVPMPGEFGSFTMGFLILRKGFIPHITYTNKFGVAYNFDFQGRLISIAPPDDSPITISYASATGNQISSVTSGSLSLKFTYSGTHISSITDPAGATFVYTYGLPSIPSNSPLAEFYQNQQQPPTGGQLLTDVTSPIGTIQCGILSEPIAGDTYYSYSTDLWFKAQASPATHFHGANGTAELTAYAKSTWRSPCIHPIYQPGMGISVLGMFSYTNSDPVQGNLLSYGGYGGPWPDVVSEASAGIVGGKLVGEVQLQFVGSASANMKNPGSVTASVFIGGHTAEGGVANRQAVSVFPAQVPGIPRLSTLTSTAGVGVAGEMQSESWGWNANLTLRNYTDGLGNTTLFSTYDSLGNPTTIVEGAGTAVSRTMAICYHPSLSRPLVISWPSVDGNPTHVHTIAWDYTSNYSEAKTATTCNQSQITPYIHQVIESGYTDETLSGTLNAWEAHVIQFHYTDLSGNDPRQNTSNTHLLLTSITGPRDGAKTSFTYAPMNQTSMPPGYLHTMSKAVSLIGPPLTTYFNQYDPDGRLTVFVESSEHTLSYDEQGDVTQTVTLSGAGPATNEFAYDLTGNLISHQTPSGTTLLYSYDSAARVNQIQGLSADGAIAWTRVIDYDSFDQPLTQRFFAGSGTDEGPRCTVTGAQEQFCQDFMYDPFERLVGINRLDQNGNPCANCTQGYGYDQDGQLKSQTMFQDNASQFSYVRDALNRVTAIQWPMSAVSAPAQGVAGTSLSYDINDRMTSRTDAPGFTSSYLYDDFGRLIAVNSADAQKPWINNYDAAGNLTASLDPLGGESTYYYDLINRRTEFQTGLNFCFFVCTLIPDPYDTVIYQYDETGAIPGMSSQGLSYYKTVGRLTSERTWSQLGNPINTHYSYDDNGWINMEVDDREADPAEMGAAALSFTYFVWGPDHELKSIMYPDGYTVDYSYGDAVGLDGTPLPSGVTAEFGGQTTPLIRDVTYFSDAQPRAFQYGDGSQLAVTRDLRGEITQVVSGPPDYPVVSETYAYAPSQIGLPITVTKNSFLGSDGERRQISYNALGWITSYNRQTLNTPTETFSWLYDTNGNVIGLGSGGYDNGAPIGQNLAGTGCSGCSGPNSYATVQPISVGSQGGSALPATDLFYFPDGSLATSVPDSFAMEGTVFRYNFRHHLITVDAAEWTNSPENMLAPDSYLAIQSFDYDGLDRLWERNDLPSKNFFFYSSNQSEQQGTGSHQYYYDPSGRLIEEVESLGGFQSGRYLVTEHVYLGTSSREVARILRTGNPWTQGLQDIGIQYLHDDGRGAIAGVETQDTSGAVTGALTSPFGQMLSYGPRGPEAPMATEESMATILPPALNNSISGASGAGSMDGSMLTQQTCASTGTSGCLINGVLEPMFGRSTVPGINIFNAYGLSPYLGDGAPGPGGAGGTGASDELQASFFIRTSISDIWRNYQPQNFPEFGPNVTVTPDLRAYLDFVISTPTGKANFSVFASGMSNKWIVESGHLKPEELGKTWGEPPKVLGGDRTLKRVHTIIDTTKTQKILNAWIRLWKGPIEIDANIDFGKIISNLPPPITSTLAHELGHARDISVDPFERGDPNGYLNHDVFLPSSVYYTNRSDILFGKETRDFVPLPPLGVGADPDINLTPSYDFSVTLDGGVPPDAGGP